MRHWIAVWETDANLFDLAAPVGSHVIFHPDQECRMVFSVLQRIGDRFRVGPELSGPDCGRILLYAEHLHFIHSHPPSSAVYLREAVRIAGGCPPTGGLRAMA